MPENSRRGVAVVQRQIADASRSMSRDYLLCQVSLLATLVVMAAPGLDGRGRWVILFENRFKSLFQKLAKDLGVCPENSCIV
jgi:hypothetical protein